MPNWSFNTMGVKKTEYNKDEIQRLRDFIKRVVKAEDGSESVMEISFQNIVPMPDALSDTIAPTEDPDSDKNKMLRAKYGADNWYDWRVKNWGVKWDALDTAVLVDDDSLYEIGFNTAWTFPGKVIRLLSRMFPTLELNFSAEEESGAYNVLFSLLGGKCIRFIELVDVSSDDDPDYVERELSTHEFDSFC